MKTIRGIVAFALLICLGLPGLALAQDPDPAFVAQLRQALRQNPDILLDVLSEHGGFLLDTIQSTSDQRRNASLIQQWENDINIPKNPIVSNRPTRGPADAPVTIVAFSDFTCAYCQQAAFSIENLLHSYQNQLQFVFKQVPHSASGKLASQWFLAAVSLDPVKAWHLYALFFDNQQALINDPEAVLRQTATQAGLDPDLILSAVSQHQDAINTILDEDAADAAALGFAGTPYFLINDLIIRGALPLEDFISAMEYALAH